MSGCVHCVWDIYQEALDDYRTEKRALRQKRKNLLLAHGKDAEAFNAENDVAAKAEEEEEYPAADPSMQAFLELEKKLRHGSGP
ncbi:hypothetical protein HDV00_001066 [Rhizophlyctis rosea]|nr:hypothetical protein HDV00_001066 [Rhizophlyctis rosea]